MGDRTERKLDISLFFACLAGAFLGFVAEEFLHLVTDSAPAVVDVALRVALFFLIVFLFALICEMVTGHLNGGSWNGRQTGRSILFIILFPVLIGLVAMLFQFIYQLDFTGERPSEIQDYIILVDNSLSVTWTDPDNERYDAVVDFVSTLNGSNQVMIKVFSDNSHYGPQNNFPLTVVTKDTPEQIRSFFDSFVIETSGTNLTQPLMDVLNEYPDKGRNAVVLMLSDGEDDTLETVRITDSYKKRGLPIYCASFAEGHEAESKLENLARGTGGEFFQLDNLSSLTRTVEQYVQTEVQTRNLLELRSGMDSDNLVARIERIVFLFILGILSGLVLTFILDSETILKEGMILHCICALISPFVMEFPGQKGLLAPLFAKLLMMLLLGVMLVHYRKTRFAFNEHDTFGGPVHRPKKGGGRNSQFGKGAGTGFGEFGSGDSFGNDGYGKGGSYGNDGFGGGDSFGNDGFGGGSSFGNDGFGGGDSFGSGGFDGFNDDLF